MNLSDISTKQLVLEIAAKSPTPGGGSVAAYTGALSAGLCAMVARVTIGKKKYREAWEIMEAVAVKADETARRFLVLMEEDANAYNGVVEAFKLPKEDDAQKQARKAAIDQAMRKATQVPLDTLCLTPVLAELAQPVVEKGNQNCITDAGAAVQLIRSSAHTAAYNVRINLASLDDPVFRSVCEKEVEAILAEMDSAVKNLEEKVVVALR